MGVPVAIDFVPLWGNRNYPHFWNVVINDGDPVKLWELFFDSNENCYYYSSLKGESFKLSDMEKYLWEMASGNNTISEIISYHDETFKKEVKVDYVIDFYIKLYENYALLFRE